MLDPQRHRTASIEEKFELIAAGAALAMVPRSVARSYSRPDLVHRPVVDVSPTETCIVVADDRRERRVRDFAATAVETLRADAPQLAVAT